MPNLNISIGKRVSDEIKNDLQFEIGSTISIIPGKTNENTVIMINDNYSMFNNGEKVERAGKLFQKNFFQYLINFWIYHPIKFK